MIKKLPTEFTVNIENLTIQQVIFILKTIQKQRPGLDRNIYNPDITLEEIVELCAPYTESWKLHINNLQWWFNTGIFYVDFTLKDFLHDKIQRKLK